MTGFVILTTVEGALPPALAGLPRNIFEEKKMRAGQASQRRTRR